MKKIPRWIFGLKCEVVIISIFAFFYTVAWNWSFSGPAYLSDTVGYLINAAIIAGYKVDAMGSWHAGYSLLLVPLFWCIDDPNRLWKGITILNAVIVSATLILAGRMMDRFRPELPYLKRIVVLLLVVLYPSFTAIAGYAYSSSAFTLLFMFIALYMSGLNSTHLTSNIVIGILVGFTYWVHPTGLAVFAAAALAFLIPALKDKKISEWMVFVVIACIMILTYKYAIHEWLYRVATPIGYERYQHYQPFSILIEVFRDPKIILRFLSVAIGQLAYQCVSTLGLVAIGMGVSFRKFYTLVKTVERNRYTDSAFAKTFTFVMFSVLGVIALMAIGVATSAMTRIDYWYYGRYTDTVMLPLFIMGAMVILEQQFRSSIIYVAPTVLFVLVVGMVLQIVADPIPSLSYQSTLSFWPHYIIKDQNYLSWMFVGGIGIVVFYLLSMTGKIGIASIIIFFAFHAYLSGSHNHDDHKNILSYYSKPSSIVDIVEANWPPGSCIGFEYPLPDGLTLMQRERYRLYAFYYFRYDYRRYSFDEWVRVCDGPMLTYAPQRAIDQNSVHLLARELSTGLFLVSKKPLNEITLIGDKLDRDDLILNFETDERCLVAGCFSMKAENMLQHSQVGRLGYANHLRSENSCTIKSTVLETTGKQGYLFFGPYRRMEAGDYYIELKAQVFEDGGSIIDIVSDKGRRKHMADLVKNYYSIDRNLITIPFSLNYNVDDLEVRLFVNENSVFKVNSYSIKLNEGME